jgi:hypothetical protein
MLVLKGSFLFSTKAYEDRMRYSKLNIKLRSGEKM